MKITASVDSQLGDRTLERGKTYDVKEPEAKHLIRAGLARESAKNAPVEVEKTVEAAKIQTPEGFEPGEDSAPSSSSTNSEVTKTSDSTARSTRKAGK